MSDTNRAGKKNDGICRCGCGGPTNRYPITINSLGIKAGDFRAFIKGHYTKYGTGAERPTPTCRHKHRPVKAKGLCGACYGQYLRGRMEPERRDAILRQSRALWKAREGARRTPEYAKKQKNRVLRHRYGISLSEHNRILSMQDGACAICKSRAKKLYVDHCHNTGRVRGLICPRCNTLCGFLDESLETAVRAVDYIGQYAKKPLLAELVRIATDVRKEQNELPLPVTSS